jgi:hypothetical protein
MPEAEHRRLLSPNPRVYGPCMTPNHSPILIRRDEAPAERRARYEQYLDAVCEYNARLKRDNRLLAEGLLKWQQHVGAEYLPSLGAETNLALDRALDDA